MAVTLEPDLRSVVFWVHRCSHEDHSHHRRLVPQDCGCVQPGSDAERHAAVTGRLGWRWTDAGRWRHSSRLKSQNWNLGFLSETKLTSQLFVWAAHMIHKFQDGVSSLPLSLSLSLSLSLFFSLSLQWSATSGARWLRVWLWRWERRFRFWRNAKVRLCTWWISLWDSVWADVRHKQQ